MSENEAIRNRVAQYLREVDSHMHSPSIQKTEVLQNLEAQILDALEKRAGRNPSVADVAAALAEMDPPQSYGDGALSSMLQMASAMPAPRMDGGIRRVALSASFWLF
jgi:hypothetical protein